jgi:hypothetical protein
MKVKIEKCNSNWRRYTDGRKEERSHKIPYPTGRRKRGQQTREHMEEQFNFSASEWDSNHSILDERRSLIACTKS